MSQADFTTTTGSDSITVDPSPTLAVAVSHTGTFTQGSTAEWNVQVSNTVSGSRTNGTITVTDALPTGYTLSGSSSSAGSWGCSGSGTALSLSTTLGAKIITVSTTSTGPPFGSLDQAVDASSHSSTVSTADNLLVTGWAADPQDGAPVSQVQILIDGTAVGNATLGFSRPDVAAALGSSTYLNSGWKFTYAASGLSVGTHTVTVVAYDSLSLSTTLGTKTITVQ